VKSGILRTREYHYITSTTSSTLPREQERLQGGCHVELYLIRLYHDGSHTDGSSSESVVCGISLDAPGTTRISKSRRAFAADNASMDVLLVEPIPSVIVSRF
jgi:hypothetical protein